MKPVLAAVTNTEKYEKFDTPTGLWFSELTHFYDEVNDEIPVVIASPKGGNIPFDPVSLRKMFVDSKTEKHFKDPAFRKALRETAKLSDLNPDDFSAIYFTGGHGTMFDFVSNPELDAFTEKVYNNGGLISAVCHGVGALSTVTINGRPLIEGKTVTGFSNAEEKLAMRTKHVPFLLEDRLKEVGANYKKATVPYTSFTEVDGRVITGQNPQSAHAVGQIVREALLNKPAS